MPEPPPKVKGSPLFAQQDHRSLQEKQRSHSLQLNQTLVGGTRPKAYLSANAYCQTLRKKFGICLPNINQRAKII